MRTVTDNFQTELDKAGGAKPRRLLEIDAIGGTLYYSGQALSMPDGTTWISRTSAADNSWKGIAWSPELSLFAAVSSDGTGDRVMTSPDGINWTSRTSAADNFWDDITYANGLFVVVGQSGSDRVMTSPDGINWTLRTAAALIAWTGVTYGNGLFVAVALVGAGSNLVQTSPDGINWTLRTAASDNQWKGIAWSATLGLFAVVASSGTGDRVMTSPDGTTWTSRTSAADNFWNSIAWSPELSLFAVVSSDGTGDRVMTSPDGINWTSRTSAADNSWVSIAWSADLGLFAVVGGSNDRVMTSLDGINWTLRTSPPERAWKDVVWSPELNIFAAVSSDGTGDRVMTSVLQEYTAKVQSFGALTSQLVPGDGAVQVASQSFNLSNIDPIDDLIVAGTEIRVYDWFDGLTATDKSLTFKGTVVGRPDWDDLAILFTANDIFQKLNKIIGRPFLAADWTEIDPDYIGWTIPILIGAGENHECIPVEAGAASTLRETFEVGHTSIKLASATLPLAFPATGTVVIGEEEYAYTGITNDDLTGVTANTTERAQYSIVLEKKAVKYVASESFTDTPVKELSVVRALPHSSNKIAEAILLDPSLYTITLAETISGNKYATILLTDDILALKKALLIEVTQQSNQPITTQPVFVTASITTVQYRPTGTFINQSYSGPSNARDSDDSTFAASPTGTDNGLVFTGPTTSLGTISAVRVVVKSISNSGSAQILAGWTGSAWRLQQTLGAGLGTRKFNVPSPAWSELSRIGFKLVSTGSNQADVYEMWYEVDYVASITRDTDAVSNRIADVEIGGDTTSDAVIGRIFCNFQGPKDKTDGHYTGTPTTQPLIEKPPDVIHFLWENFSNGAVHADLDIAGSFLDARTNLTGYKYGVALTWQVGLDVLSTQLAQMAHSWFFTSAGLAKFARILTIGTPVKTIDTDDYSPLTEGPEKKIRIRRLGGAIENIINKVDVRYNHNPVLGSRSDPNAYASNSESLDASATASIATYGERRRSIPWLMWAVRDATMAGDLKDKLLARNQYPRTTTIFPSWVDLSLIEPTDLIALTAEKLRIFDAISEITTIGNVSQSPKDFRSTEIMITVRDLGFILITPTPASCITGVVAPTVVLGSISITPTPASCITGVVAPTVVIGVYYNSANYFDSTKYFNE